MMSHALQEMRVTVHLLVFTVDTVVVFASLVLAGFIALGMPRSRNAWLAAGILLGGICAVVLGRFQYGYWIPEPYRIQIGPWEPVLNIGRNLSPALLMLLCRSLFQEPRRLPRSLLGLIVLQILLEEPIHLLVGDATPTERLLTEVAPAVLQALFGTLAVYWTVAGWPTDLVEARRRMRVIVLGVSGLLMVGTVLLLRVVIPWDSAQNYYAAEVLGTLHAALLTVILASLLSAERLAQYLEPGRPAARRTPSGASPDTTAADAARLEEQMAEGAYRQPGLSIASLAVQLGLPEYRLRRLIHESLGFRNFNSFLHHYRIGDACRRLRDPAERRTPILTIALSVGYQSINTFNRGFREVVGVTPSAYRAGKDPRNLENHPIC